MSTKQTSQIRENSIETLESENLTKSKTEEDNSTCSSICAKFNFVVEKILDRLFVVNPESLKLQKWLLLMYRALVLNQKCFFF